MSDEKKQEIFDLQHHVSTTYGIIMLLNDSIERNIKRFRNVPTTNTFTWFWNFAIETRLSSSVENLGLSVMNIVQHLFGIYHEICLRI